MTTHIEGHIDAVMSALRVARQNEERWMEMYPEFSADSEGMEQWTSIARLRRLEVERIESILKRLSEKRCSLQLAGHKNAVACSDQKVSSSKSVGVRLTDTARGGISPRPF